MSDTSGIPVCFGNVQGSVLLENAKLALRDMSAKWSDKIQIDPTLCVLLRLLRHLGLERLGTPVVRQGPEGIATQYTQVYQSCSHWILACHTEKKFAREIY